MNGKNWRRLYPCLKTENQNWRQWTISDWRRLNERDWETQRELNVKWTIKYETTDNRAGQHWVAIYIDANSKAEYYYPIGTPPYQDPYENFMKKHCHTWTYNAVAVHEYGSMVCGHHCVFYLIHRCAGNAITDVTRLLEDPAEFIIVQNSVLLLV